MSQHHGPDTVRAVLHVAIDHGCYIKAEHEQDSKLPKGPALEVRSKGEVWDVPTGLNERDDQIPAPRRES